MVEAINGLSNRNRNTLIGAGCGLVGASAAGYLSYSILDKNKNFKDEFVHKITLKDAEDKEQRKVFNLSRKIDKMNENTSVSSLKKVLGKMAKLSDKAHVDMGEDVHNIIKNGTDEQIKTLFQETKDNFVIDYQDVRKDIEELLDAGFDKKTKNFSFNDKLTDTGKEVLQKAKKMVRNTKLKRAALFGGAGAVIVGAGTYIAAASADKHNKADSMN